MCIRDRQEIFSHRHRQHARAHENRGQRGKDHLRAFHQPLDLVVISIGQLFEPTVPVGFARFAVGQERKDVYKRQDILRLGDDIVSQQGLMFSKELYNTYFKPRIKRIVAAAKEVNPDIIIFMHSCGKIEGMIDELIDAGVEVLNPVQPECNDQQAIKRTYGDRLSFWGGVGAVSYTHLLVKSTTRILMPLSLLVGILLIINGTPMTFKGQQHLTTLEGTEQVISQGPTAAIVPIKQLGTNGGGYFGVNSSHPLENPNAFTNMLECWSILILPMAMVFALGFYLKRRKLAWTIYGVMLFAYLVGITVSVNQEMGGNPQIAGMGISQDMGSMEGKEVRIGSAASAMWGMTTTVTSNGSVNRCV